MAKKKKTTKGNYSRAQMPVADAYPKQGARRRWALWGAVLALAVLAYVGIEFVLVGDALSPGKLSSAHAALSDGCESCHVPFQTAATPEQCSDCHEVWGRDPGVFSFTAHYLYNTTDFTRVETRSNEGDCVQCHQEHLGRDADITRRADRNCLGCHDYGSFDGAHPEFFVHREPEKLPQPTLAFTHIQHVRELIKNEGLTTAEESCVYCHEPTPDGRGFLALDFERSCDACHLTTSEGTARLPIAREGAPIGVETLEAIRARGGPGDIWADYANPTEFKQSGGRVVAKKPLHHNDAWVLANLRRLRGQLYENAPLADLLRASAEVEPDQIRELYGEAVKTLRDYARGLRGSDDANVQATLAQVDGLLDNLEDRIADPYAPLDETQFLLDLVPRELPADQREELTQLVADLTEACARCHVVQDATIARVDTSLSKYKRAHFDHSAHILQRNCLDCHNQIPIAQYAFNEDEVDPAVDHAGIVNLPTIESCQDCHDGGKAPSKCSDCHAFHPEGPRHTPHRVTAKENAP